MTIEYVVSMLRKYRETIAYLFIGGTTVLVNIAAYWLFTPILGDIGANTVAFFIAVMYAYFTNSLFVFRRRLTWVNFFQFWGMRIGTLLIDDGGMWLMLAAGCNRLVSKAIVNIVIIALNYVFSKFVIFRTNPDNPKGNDTEV